MHVGRGEVHEAGGGDGGGDFAGNYRSHCDQQRWTDPSGTAWLQGEAQVEDQDSSRQRIDRTKVSK